MSQKVTELLSHHIRNKKCIVNINLKNSLYQPPISVYMAWFMPEIGKLWPWDTLSLFFFLMKAKSQKWLSDWTDECFLHF